MKKLLTLFTLLLTVCSGAWGDDTVLFSTDFTESGWSSLNTTETSQTLTIGTQTVYVRANNTDNLPSVNTSTGTLTWGNRNFSNKDCYIAIPVNNVNGSLTITVTNNNSNTRFNYATSTNSTVSNPSSTTSSTAANPSTVTLNGLTGTFYMVYIGRQGGSYTNATAITITTSAETKYNVTYHANGSGEDDITHKVSTVEANMFTWTGHNFIGWNTQADGKGTAYAVGAAVTGILELFAQWEEIKYTVTYNANCGSCATASETQASAGAALTLPTPTWAGYTFNGWYNAGSKIGDAGDSYTPTANITLYAKWTDNIEGKLFSYVDGNYGDKFQAFDDSGWVTANATGKSKTFTDGVTGAQFVITNGAWDNKTNAISALAKYIASSTTMKVVVPTGYKATVNIWYNSYGDSKLLKVDGDAQTAPGTNKLSDSQTNAQIYSKLVAVTVTEKNGEVVLTSSGSSDNIYIARVAVTLTHVSATITEAGYASFASTSALDFSDSGITAYIATANGTDNVTMTEIAKVPANTGVVLKGTKGTVNVPVLTGDADDTTGNLLKPGEKTVDEDEATAGTIYAFGKKGGQVGFVRAHEGFTIAAGKAYLDLNGKLAKGADFLSFVFGDEGEETDGIKAVSTTVENGVRYNLAGQKVGADYKGIVIVNGKKVIIK